MAQKRQKAIKVTLVIASSINGKITIGDNPHVGIWTSKEDKSLFSYLKKKNNLLVMGSKTYEAIKNSLTLDKETLRIVLTKHPKKYASSQVKNMLEFSSESPSQLVNRLEKQGYKQLLLVAGGTITAEFFKESLIDEMFLTIEPMIFGEGKNLVKEGQFNVDLKLISMKRLNEKGTLIFRYKVLK